MGRARNGDGSVFLVKTGANKGRWVARLSLPTDDATGKRRRWEITRRTREEAYAELRTKRAELDTTGAIKGHHNMGDWLTYWLEDVVRPARKPRVYDLYKSTVEKWIRPAFGRMEVSAIKASHVRRLIRDCREATSTGNAARVHRVLSSCLSEAVREDLVDKNAARQVPVKAGTGSRPALSVVEGRAIIAHLAGRPDRARWLLALLTGARQAECLGLTWDRVDLKAGTIDISHQLYQLPTEHGCLDAAGKPTCGRTRVSYCPKATTITPADDSDYDLVPLEGVFALLAPKSVASRRMIPTPAILTDALREHRKTTMSRVNPHGLVFTNGRGKPVARRVDSAAWDAMLRDAKVSDVPLHSARHTAATLLMEGGVDGLVIQSILGHASLAAGDPYKHVDLTLARQALDGLGEALG